MYILGIETTCALASAALTEDGRLLREEVWQGPMTHLQHLLPLIDRVLKQEALQLSDLGAIAVSRGPGSFTGIRIGMATAKALAQVRNIPVVPVPTLFAMAWANRRQEAVICPVLDARRNQVYGAAYRFSGKEAKERLKEGAYDLEQVLSAVSQEETVCFLGDGLERYGSRIEEALGERAVFLPEEERLQRAAAVSEIGFFMYQRGLGENYVTAMPEYLRSSEAERNLLAKQKKEREKSMPAREKRPQEEGRENFK